MKSDFSQNKLKFHSIFSSTLLKHANVFHTGWNRYLIWAVRWLFHEKKNTGKPYKKLIKLKGNGEFTINFQIR